MDDLKELFITVTDRIRTPIFLPFLFSFLSLNWKAIYFVVFSKAEVVRKFDYFDDNTTTCTLIILPLIIAILYAVLSPFFHHGIFKLTQHRSSELKKDKIKQETNIISHRADLIDEINKERLKKEKDLLDQAAIDQRIESEISDPIKQEEVQSKIKAIREDAQQKTSAISKASLQSQANKNKQSIPPPDLDKISSVFAKKKVKLTPKQKTELMIAMNAITEALKNTHTPPFSIHLEGYSNKSSDWVDIIVDGVEAKLDGFGSGTDLKLEKDVFFSMLNGEITFEYIMKKNEVFLMGDSSAVPNLNDFFTEASKFYSP